MRNLMIAILTPAAACRFPASPRRPLGRMACTIREQREASFNARRHHA
jgi:hypothetical protein